MPGVILEGISLKTGISGLECGGMHGEPSTHAFVRSLVDRNTPRPPCGVVVQRERGETTWYLFHLSM